MKINVGIVGYGKLGMAIKKLISLDSNFCLVKIFSRRNIKGCETIKNLYKYKNKIDLLFLCVGSQTDLNKTAFRLIKNFNFIDVYDNHDMLQGYICSLNKICKENKKVCFSALGWDPGILSLIRALYFALGLNYITLWGKGVSQGHTNAIKNVPGVIDAIQFTIPLKKKNKAFKQTGNVENKTLHLRMCYVVARKNVRKSIKQQIVNMEHYFKGNKTKVKFVSSKKLKRLKTDFHKGEIITQNNVSNFSLDLQSNPDFTAKVMLVYAKVMIDFIKNKKYGSYTILDIPLSNLVKNNKYNIL